MGCAARGIVVSASHPPGTSPTIHEGLDVAVLVARWRDGDLDAGGLLATEVTRALRRLVADRGPVAIGHLDAAVTTVADATSPVRRDDVVWARVIPSSDDAQWKTWPGATFAAGVLASLADRMDDIASLDLAAPGDSVPLVHRAMLRLVEVEGLEVADAGLLLCVDRSVALDILDEAHHCLGWDRAGQVLCRGWVAVRSMDRRTGTDRVDAQRHLANCRACGRAWADRLRRREFLLRLLPSDVLRRRLVPVPKAPGLAGVDAREAMDRA